MRRIVRVLAVAATVGTLAACSGTGTTARSPAADRHPGRPTPVTGTPVVQQRWTSCAVDAPMDPEPRREALTLPRLDPGFPATAAIHCQLDSRRRTDGGTELVATEGRATDLTALLAALRQPDASATPEVCNLDMPWVPNLLLRDDRGRWIRPGIPVDGCGRPLPDLVSAVRGLRFTTVSEQVVREIESAGAARAGCPQTYQNMVAVETGHPYSPVVPGWGSVPFPSAAPLRLCAYRVPAEGRATANTDGDFAYGLTFPPLRRASVEQALTRLPPATDCAGRADRFAVLSASGGLGGVVCVELDHCRRVLITPLSGPPTLARADDAFLGLLGA